MAMGYDASSHLHSADEADIVGDVYYDHIDYMVKEEDTRRHTNEQIGRWERMPWPVSLNAFAEMAVLILEKPPMLKPTAVQAPIMQPGWFAPWYKAERMPINPVPTSVMLRFSNHQQFYGALTEGVLAYHAFDGVTTFVVVLPQGFNSEDGNVNTCPMVLEKSAAGVEFFC